MNIRSLTILTHARQGLPAGSFMAHFVEAWREEGRKVFVHQGLGRPPDADAAWLHVDLSVVPEPYLALMERFPLRINGAVRDIRRRTISEALVWPDDHYAGPVIVKTDLNYRGKPEADLERRTASRLRRLAGAFGRRLPARLSGRLPGGEYLVLPHKAAVPAWIWRAPGLVVERFFGHLDGRPNRVGMWYFLGRRQVVAPIAGRDAVLRFDRNAETLPLEDEAPAEAQRRRGELGFDYGKFDLITLPEGTRVIDANRTPYAQLPPLTGVDLEICRRLAPGLDDLAR